MTQPTFLGYGLAVVMVAVSTYCIGRLLAAKRWDRSNDYGVNVSHVLMGLAMAGMLVPQWNPVPDRFWIVAFCLVAAWFLVMSVRFVAEHGLSGSDEGHGHHISHYLIHMTMAGAMVYMYEVSVPAVAASSAASMFGPAARSQSSYLGLSFLFIVILLASAVWQIDALGKFSPRQMAVIGAAEPPPPGAGPVVSPPGQRWLAPRLEIACHVSMCFAMAYMLVLML